MLQQKEHALGTDVISNLFRNSEVDLMQYMSYLMS